MNKYITGRPYRQPFKIILFNIFINFLYIYTHAVFLWIFTDYRSTKLMASEYSSRLSK